MRYRQPLKQILSETREQWNRPDTHPAVRKNFEKVTLCRTMALGAEVYASETEERVFPHTCKSRACPSCGYRATTLWQRDQWATLPNVRYIGINFTMPDVLWPIFRSNRHLLHDLPALAASVIQQYLKLKHGVRGLIIVVPHTFGRKLNFNPHLHTLVSAGGLREAENCWVNVDEFDKNSLMQMWKFALITYLRHALSARALQSNLSEPRLKQILTLQYERWWNVYLARFASKEQFVRYAGRYIRRPPIAEHRFVKIGDGEVQFQTKDLKLKKYVVTRYSTDAFVRALADHVPNRYRHAIRYFDLLAPRAKGRIGLGLLALLRQPNRPRPLRLSWAESLRRDFKRDPLLDSSGQRMRWVRRATPQTA